MAILAALLVLRLARSQVAFVTGAVLRDDADPNKQRPVANASVSAVSGASTGESRSDASGFFRVRLRPAVGSGEPVALLFQHPEYEPAEITRPAGRQVHIVRLTPKAVEREPEVAAGNVPITNIRVRYAHKSTATVEVGSVARTFKIENKGNVPCDNTTPCSPDGEWMAAIRPLSLDAGAGRQFRNVRVSCIAGPCPFTRIEKDEFSRGGRVISVSVRNWSDTVTYLVEAEVAHTMFSEAIRHSYPVIFGRSMNFTLPPTAQGPSIEAEVGGSEIVFPLGPKLKLSWAECRLEVAPDRTRLYRCELKSNYRFE
jgi:hypothetical protein